MRGTKMFSQVREAISNLNPHDVREIADRPFALELYANDNPGYWEMERFFFDCQFSTPFLEREVEAGSLPASRRFPLPSRRGLVIMH